jgi:hypothetical protein
MINFLPRTKPINETAGGSDHLTNFGPVIPVRY